MLEITDVARDKIKEVLSENSGKYLRIEIEAGWGGPRLGLALDELKENEETIKVNSIEVLISDEVKPYSDGSKIDYIQSTDGEGFVINQPGQTGCSGCSCWYSLTSAVNLLDDTIISSWKQAIGLRLFYGLHGVRVVGGSNPLTPTIGVKGSSGHSA